MSIQGVKIRIILQYMTRANSFQSEETMRTMTKVLLKERSTMALRHCSYLAFLHRICIGDNLISIMTIILQRIKSLNVRDHSATLSRRHSHSFLGSTIMIRQKDACRVTINQIGNTMIMKSITRQKTSASTRTTWSRTTLVMGILESWRDSHLLDLVFWTRRPPLWVAHRPVLRQSRTRPSSRLPIGGSWTFTILIPFKRKRMQPKFLSLTQIH